MNDFRDPDAMIIKLNGEKGFKVDFIFQHGHFTFDDALLFNAMDLQYSFGADDCLAGFRKINGLDYFSGKSCVSKLVCLKIIFIEMDLLQWAVEAFKGAYSNLESKGAFDNIDASGHLIRGRLDYFQRRIGTKSYFSVIGSEYSRLWNYPQAWNDQQNNQKDFRAHHFQSSKIQN